MLSFKNNQGNTIYKNGQLGLDWFQMPDSQLPVWAEDAQFLSDIAMGKVKVKGHDGQPVENPSKAVNLTLGNLTQKVIQQLTDAGELSLRPRGFGFTATKNGMTTHELVLDETLVLRGGTLFSPNAEMGDWVRIFITDDSDVEITEYVKKMMVYPGMIVKIEDVDVSSPIPQGYKLKVDYHSVGTVNDPKVGVNLTSYEMD